MRKTTDYVLDREGNAVVGAEVYIRNQADNTLATIYSDDGSTTTTNPLVTDSDGEFSFWVANGTYKIQAFVDGVQEQEVTNVQIFDLDGITAFGFSLIDDANAAAALTTLGVSAFAQTLLDDADAATARATLGVSIGTAGALDVATTAQIRSNTADKVLATDETWAAADEVALTPGTNVAVDMSTGINFSLAMGGNYTLDNPTNTKPGQSGEIYITQDGTGSRTLAYGSNWKFVGASDPVLSTAAGAVDVLSYKVRNSTYIIAALSKAFG